MIRDPLAGFADIAPATTKVEGDYYPGSKKKRRAVEAPADPWAGVKGVELLYKGQTRTFYLVSVLAEALGRQSQTVRKWEKQGYIPETRYRSPGRGKHGQRRLYTREQIEGIAKIAEEEGILGESSRNVSATRFPERVKALFKELQ